MVGCSESSMTPQNLYLWSFPYYAYGVNSMSTMIIRVAVCISFNILNFTIQDPNFTVLSLCC